MTFSIIPIQEQHIEGFHHALDQVARERRYLAFLEAPSLESSYTYALNNIKRNIPHFVALKEDKVIGWCNISMIERPIFSHVGVLGMGVLAEHRGKGVGKALIQATLEASRNIGLTRIELIVREGNLKAMRLYKAFGFCIEGIKRRAGFMDGQYEDITCMALLFDEDTP